MNHCGNRNYLALDSIDYPITIGELFSNALFVKLWDNSPSKREIAQISCNIEDFSNYCCCIGRGVL
ncbi:MAG: hypothetical protein V7641_2692 [Blastocatellia bacterium]